MVKKTGFIITAGHLDVEWYQPLRSYRFWTAETFNELKKACGREDFSSYVLDGQVFPLEEYLEIAPEDENVMREFIKAGKLAVGPFYTQFDEWLPSSESIVRNCLYGRRRADAFGKCMLAGYLPDNFGHPVQLPQILRGFGLDSLLFMRGLPEIPGGHPDEFLYEGIDGSRVLVSHFRETYGGAFDLFYKKIDPIQPRVVPYYDSYLSFEWHKEISSHDDPEYIAKSMIANAERIENRYPSGVIPLVAGFDHLPPQVNIGDSVKKANEIQDKYDFIMGTAEDYIKTVYAQYEKNKNTGGLPVYAMELIGSRYQYILLGALSTRSYLKRENFACEALMERYTEPLTALASIYGYQECRRLTDEAWEYLMLNSAHDSIHGSSTDEVHIEMQARYAAARQIAAGLIHETLSYCGKHVNRWWKKLPEHNRNEGILTYAPVQTDFAQLSELWLPAGDCRVSVQTEGGASLPCQILERESAEINSIGVPRNELFPDNIYRKILFLDKFTSAAVNTHAAVIGNEDGAEVYPFLEAGNDYMENEFLKVEMNGALIHIFDKKARRWFRNLNLLEEEADTGDAWDYSPTWLPSEKVYSADSECVCKMIENGPVRAVLEIKLEMDLPARLIGEKRSKDRVGMPVVFKISMYGGIPRVDIKLIIQNTAEDHRIRLRLNTDMKCDFIRSQSHFAVIDRPVDVQAPIEEWLQPKTRLYPFREWLAVQDKKCGIAVAVKGIYDYEPEINKVTGFTDVSLTLLRGIQKMARTNTPQRTGAASWAFDTPGAQCLGIQEFEWSYIPYTINETEKTPFISLVHSFLYPPVSHAVRSERESNILKYGIPIFSWNADNIQFSAFKKCYDGDGYILRVYENQGKAVKVKINTGNFTEAWLADLNEQPCEGSSLQIIDGAITVEAAPYKIITVKLTL